MLEQGHRYVDGGFRRGSHGETHDVIDSADGTVVTRAALATPVDVDSAASAAARTAWARDTFRTLPAGREIRGRSAWIDDHIPIVRETPHGGYPASGFGTDMSPYSVDENTQVTHVSFEIIGAPRTDRHRTIFGDR